MILFYTVLSVFAAPVGQFGVSVSGINNMPLGDLSNWFKPAPALSAGFGQQFNPNWFVEGLLEVCRYEDENLSGYSDGRLDLSLEHVSLIINGRHDVARMGPLVPYLNVGVGLSYWKGVRGEIEANPNLGIPHINEKVLEEANWGFRAGLGIEWLITKQIGLDVQANYRLIVGDLWPTMQPHIELEGVSGFSSLQAAVGIRYYF